MAPTLTEQLGTITAIVALALGIVQVLKLLLVKYKMGIVNSLPTPAICIGVSMGLTLLANLVLKSLPGSIFDLLWQAALAAGAASGLFSWLSEPLDSPANKISPKTPLFLLGALGLSLVLTGGCVGTQPMSNSQQYGIASASVRAVVDSLTAAGKNKLISDEDVVAIDPFVKQAFDSLRSMRTAVLAKDPIKCQWYLLQVQRLVNKIGTMETQAKELKDGTGNLNGYYRGDEHSPGLDYGAGRGSSGYAGLYPGRVGGGGCPEQRERAELGGDGGGGEGAACWRSPCPAPVPLLSIDISDGEVVWTPGKEVEFD